MNVGYSIARHSLPSIAPSLSQLGVCRSSNDVALPCLGQPYDDRFAAVKDEDNTGGLRMAVDTPLYATGSFDSIREMKSTAGLFELGVPQLERYEDSAGVQRLLIASKEDVRNEDDKVADRWRSHQST